jgi:hypothetical protein
LFAALLIGECLFLPETLFPRALVLASEERARSTQAAVYIETSEIKRTKQLKYLVSPPESYYRFMTADYINKNLRKIPGVIHPKPWDTIIRATKIFAYPTVLISVFSFVFFQYWWICSLLTMEPAAYATYKLQVQGLFFLGLILGTVFAEILFSGRLSDWLMIFLAKRNNGVRSPEMRLWLGYPAAILSSLGLLIWGLSIDRNWHWITGQIAFFLCK